VHIIGGSFEGTGSQVAYSKEKNGSGETGERRVKKDRSTKLRKARAFYSAIA